MSGRRLLPRHNTTDSPERDVYKKGGKLQITISTDDSRQDMKSRCEFKSHNRSSENEIYQTSRRRHNSQRNGEKRFCSSENRYLDDQKSVRDKHQVYRKHTRLPSTSIRHHPVSSGISRKRRNIYSGSGVGTHHVSRTHHHQDNIMQRSHKSDNQQLYKTNEHHGHYRSNKQHRQYRSDKQYRKYIPDEQYRKYKSQEQHRNYKSDEPHQQYRSDNALHKNGKVDETSVHHRSKRELAKKSRTHEEYQNVPRSDIQYHNSNELGGVHHSHSHNKSDKSHHHRRSDKSDKCSANISNSSNMSHSSSSKSHSSKKVKSENGHSKRSLTPAQSSAASASESSSDDDRAIRMKLLREKYTKRKNSSSHVYDVMFMNEEEEDEIFDNKKSSSESDSNDIVHKKYGKSTSNTSKLATALSDNPNKSKNAKNSDHKSQNAYGNNNKHNSKSSESLVASSKVKLAAASHKRGYKQDNCTKLKMKKTQPVCSSSSSNTSSACTSSSTESSDSDSLTNNPTLKRSRWNSGSSSEDKSLIKPLKHALSKQSLKTKPIGPPLADKEILDMIRPACKDSMIRQRNCKYCALNLKTKDDVNRHTLTQRHQIVTGEYFLHNEHLINSPYLGDTIQCTICNTSLGTNVSIARHEDSSLHRQQMHRWVARHQPQPPVKYYIDPD